MIRHRKRFLLVHPPHQAVSSRCHTGKMPPLGLLSIGGPLIDAGYDVRLVDGDIQPFSVSKIVMTAKLWKPDAVLIGASGSTSAHLRCVEIAKALKAVMPDVLIIYGGVFPTFHANDILAEHRDIDIIVLGEGEETILNLASAILSGSPFNTVSGIAFREHGIPVITPPAPLIQFLDNYRIGWELIENWDDYQYWGVGRAAIIQFSRGCVHRCSYCGQREFWSKWRHRDPYLVAREIAWLHHEHGVRFVDLADENPTTSQQLWKTFLEALIAENVPVHLVGTLRAGDIVRDRAFLHLYKKAGFSRILIGTETTNPKTLVRIRKDTTQTVDRMAVKLLRRHDIISQVSYVVGFEEETDRDYFNGIRQLVAYDPDQVNAMYATPHRWTDFYLENADRKIVEPDLSKWDYRHQVLSTHIPPWRVIFWVKLTELILQLRPRAVWRALRHPDSRKRRIIRWCYTVGRQAWNHEIREFIKGRKHRSLHMTLGEFLGPQQKVKKYIFHPKVEEDFGKRENKEQESLTAS